MDEHLSAEHNTHRQNAHPQERTPAKCILDATITYGYLKFAFQAILSLTVMGFCIGMLASKTGSAEVYLPLVTAIIGFWLPSPRFPVTAETVTSNSPPLREPNRELQPLLPA